MPIARPKIFQPFIRVYERPIHPELFRQVASRRISRAQYELQLTLTTSGHVLTWTDGERYLTEVLSTTICELPARWSLDCDLLESVEGPIHWPDDPRYRSEATLSEVPAEFFRTFEEECLHSLEPDGLFYRFDFSGRVALGGVSYLGIESRRREVKIRTVHTFPDDSVLLHTETRFRD